MTVVLSINLWTQNWLGVPLTALFENAAYVERSTFVYGKSDWSVEAVGVE